MPYNLTQQQVSDLTTLRNAGDYAGFYSAIYDLTANTDTGGTVIDPNVREWFRVASDANAGVGSSSELIRDYTGAQISLRTGAAVTSAHLDEASNTIAESIFQTYVLAPVAILPTLTNIRDTDAAEMVSSLQSNGYNIDIDSWSGNLLFVGLGDTTPLNSNLLADPNSSYDLFASAAALQQAGLGTAFSAGWGSFLNTLSLPADAAGAANSAVNTYLTSLYGSFAPSAIELFGLSTTLVGRQSNNQDIIFLGNGLFVDHIVNSGDGNDVINGFSDPASQLDYGGIIDGGSDYDVVSFYQASIANEADYTVTLENIQSSVPFSGSVELPYGSISVLFDIESLTEVVADFRTSS